MWHRTCGVVWRQWCGVAWRGAAARVCVLGGHWHTTDDTICLFSEPPPSLGCMMTGGLAVGNPPRRVGLRVTVHVPPAVLAAKHFAKGENALGVHHACHRGCRGDRAPDEEKNRHQHQRPGEAAPLGQLGARFLLLAAPDDAARAANPCAVACTRRPARGGHTQCAGPYDIDQRQRGCGYSSTRGRRAQPRGDTLPALPTATARAWRRPQLHVDMARRHRKRQRRRCAPGSATALQHL